MKLHLFIPSLFWSDITSPEIYHDLSLPSLEALLAKSKVTKSPASDLDAWLCQSFNIEKQLDWPIAPITLQIDSIGRSIDTCTDYWLRADPVHLRIEHNHILLADNHVFDLSKEESILFTNTINQYLKDDKLTLLPLHPHRWYIRLTEAPELHTHTLNAITCKNINHFLPTGKESLKWHRIFNEIQMLLYEHPLNQARAERNQIAINSIWFWGGGFLPKSSSAPYTKIWSEENLSQALANISNISHSKPPANVSNWIQTNNKDNQLVVLDSLSSKDKYNNAYAWREDLKKLEKTWFVPLYTALINNHIKELRISTTNENISCDFLITKNSFWKFWKTIKPLSYYAV